ncbi:hypothetical protein [Niallia sp. 03091]|uniref:hypothetical protein n=1 Tax=Niallia sp. 03091 TaxID=3458059 RepID=UPI00404487ED
MALQVSFTLPAGCELASFQSDIKIKSFIYTEDYPVTNGYVKIDSFSGSRDLLKITVHFKKERGYPVLLIKDYAFVPDTTSFYTDNFLTQGYEYLKSLPEFAGSIDVLEEGQPE